jgi:outer membrane protein TolC
MKTSRFGVSLLALALAAGSAAAAVPEELPATLDLKGAVFYALDHNYAILQSREQIRQQDGVILQVEAAGIPNVSAVGSLQRNSAAISETYPPSSQEWTAELKATQTLFAGGGVRSSVKNAQLTRDAALFALQASINAALLDVRTKFYNVLLTREKVRVQEENVELSRRQLRDTGNQFEAGSVSNFEVLRARVALANAQPDLITARNDYRVAIEQLRQSLGAPSSAAFPAIEGGLDYQPENYDLDASLTAAHEHRPELLELTKQAEAGEQAVRTAQSTYYPSLALFGGYEYGGESTLAVANAPFPPGNYTAGGWMVGLQSSWAIFDGRATTGKVRQARSLLEQARLQRSQEELAIDVDVRQAFSSWQEAAELVDASRQTVDQAAEALRLANTRFEAGTATQLDVLNSQVALTQARTDQLQANYTYLVAVATLRNAMGLGDALIGN